MKSIFGILAAVALIAAADVAFAEVDLFDIQKDILLGKTTVTAPAGTKEADLAAIVKCLKGAKDITLDLSGTQLKAIPDKAFERCTALKTVILPKGVTSIGEGAFYWCSLTSVVIPKGVTSIEKSAFSECNSLKSVEIPESVTRIGVSAFGDCSKLTKIDVAPESNSYVIEDGVLFSKDKKNLICFPAGKSDEYYEIPKGTVNIAAGAFYGCESLKAIKIPEGVTGIGDSAFSGCNSLKSVVIPPGVTRIGEGVFWECMNLKSVVIPESVTSIGAIAFEGCYSLTSVTFGDTVGWYADEGLTKSVAAGQLASRVKDGDALYKRVK